MAIYAYQCINRSGETVNGSIDAVNEADAYEKLKNMNLMLVDLKEQKEEAGGKKISFFEKKVSVSELSLFSSQLSVMLGAGIPVTRAIHTLSRQMNNPKFKRVLESIASSVESGMNLTESMSQFPKVFSSLYLSMIQAGEVSGTLEITLDRLAEQLKREKQLNDNIKSAVIYPEVIAGLSVLLLVAMLWFIVPIFERFVPDSSKIPFATKVVFSMSHSLRSRYYIWIAIVAVSVVMLILMSKSPAVKYVWERVKFKIPIFGKLIHKVVITRFLRTFATLLEGGIPVIQALENAGPTSGSRLIADAVSDVILKVQEGRSIAEPLEESRIFPPMVIHMIAVGEETGALPSLLIQISEFYEAEVEVMSRGLTAMLQPVMLIVVGVIVGGMIIAMYMPMFSSITSTGSI